MFSIPMDVSCPQCGNPNLDVDAQNNVVYCRKCGFAVQVDPQTGNVVPLSPPQGAMAGGAGMQQAVPGVYRKPEIFGMDALTFFMLGTAVLLLATLAYNLDLTIFVILEIVLFLVYWKFK